VKILALRLKDGSVSIFETPPPVLAPGYVRVRTLYSAVSPGTEGHKIVTGKKSLLGKARARPDQVKAVIDMARSVGLKGTIQKVRARLEGAEALGYSLAGEVLEVGEGVQKVKPGQLVACGGGGYASHADEVVVPANLVARVPESVPADAAALTTLGAIALQGLRLAAPTLGENAVVIGLGVVGLMASQLLKANGCRVFGTDISAEAVALGRRTCSLDGAGRLGDDPVEEQIKDFTRGRGADVVLICAATASNDPVELASRIARQRARVVVVGAVGMDLPREEFYRKEISFAVSCSYGPGRYDPSYEEGGLDYPYGHVRWTEGRNLEAALDLMASGEFDPLSLVTHRFPFAEAPRAYQLLAAGEEPYAGILLEYPDRPVTPSGGIEIGAVAAGSGKVGVGCIGAGSYAQAFLLPPLASHRDSKLTAIFTRTGLSAVDAGKRFGFARACDSVAAVLADEATDAVVVATRHDQHGPVVLAALDAGKHVFVEKPLCVTQEELVAIAGKIRALAAADRLPVLQVGFNRRFSQAARVARKHFGKSPGPLCLGYRVNAGFVPAEHWAHDPLEGGGRIVGEVCHFIDLMQYLTGADPVEVFAACIDTADEAMIPQDHVQITVRFADGSVGNVGYFASGARTMPKERLEILGAGRSAVIENFNAVRLYTHRGETRKRCAGKGQEEEIAAFLAGVQTGQPPLPVASQLATTLATLQAVASLRTGRPERIAVEELLAE